MPRCAQAVHTECQSLVVDIAADQTVVSTTPVLLFGIAVNTTLNANAVAISDGAVTVVSLPASLAAGNFREYPGIRFLTSLVVNPAAAGTGNITISYRPYNVGIAT